MATRYFGYIVNMIGAAKSEADTLAATVEHHGIAGQIRETAARRCADPFLTRSYQRRTGKVIDSMGNISDQIDLLVRVRDAHRST